jgi:microcystin-dependent protein
VSEPFIGELRLMGFTFPPRGWATCDGQLLGIAQNQALFSVLSTTYGGDGVRTFGLPDLRGRTPLNVGVPFTQGELGGEELHTLTQNEVPTHLHVVQASKADANTPNPANALLASANNAYAPPKDLTSLDPSSVGNAGRNQGHENRHPYTVLNWCIALVGVYPSRN